MVWSHVHRTVWPYRGQQWDNKTKYWANHTPTQSVPTQPIYVHQALNPPQPSCFIHQNMLLSKSGAMILLSDCIFQTQHCWSLILFLTADQGERSALSVRHLCISNDYSQHQKINFHHCRHTSASIHWYQESQCSPPQPQFFNLATHQSQHSIYLTYIHIYMYTMTAQTTNYCGPCSIAIMVYRLIFGSPNLG